MKYTIDRSEPENPILRIAIDGQAYSFSLRSIPEEKHVWLAAVVSGHMQSVHEHAVEETTKEFKANIRKALML